MQYLPPANGGRQWQTHTAPGPVSSTGVRSLARGGAQAAGTDSRFGVTMRCCVLLFARAKDLAGTSSVTLDLPAGATVADLRRRLSEDNPSLAPLVQRSALAVNGALARAARVGPSAAAVALLPPVRGRP